MGKVNSYSDAGPLQPTDLMPVSRSPFTAGTFYNRSFANLTLDLAQTAQFIYGWGAIAINTDYTMPDFSLNRLELIPQAPVAVYLPDLTTSNYPLSKPFEIANYGYCPLNFENRGIFINPGEVLVGRLYGRTSGDYTFYIQPNGARFTVNQLTYGSDQPLSDIYEKTFLNPLGSGFKVIQVDMTNTTITIYALYRDFEYINVGSFDAEIYANDGTSLLSTVKPGETHIYTLIDKSTPNGNFLIRVIPPSPVSGAYLVSTNNLSDISSSSTARTNLGLGSIATHATTEYCATANNLSDVPNKATARTNLGLGTIATHPTTDYCATANNLSDVASTSSARTNLGLGTIATHATTEYCATANNLSDIVSQSSARTNLGLGTIATHNTTEYAATANNLSDLANVTTARTNLGLGSIATHATSEYCATANNLSDVANASTSRTNLGIAFTYNTFTYSGTFSLPAILQTMILVPTFSTDAFKLPNMTTDSWTLNRPFLIINSSGTSAPIKLFDASALTTIDPYETIEVICTDKSTSNGTFVILNHYLQTAGSFANFLRKDFNLSDVADAGLSRINLGLGSIATHNTSEYCATANNLSDLASTATARTNLGLGSIATHATTEYCATANNLSDLASATTARTNLGLGSIATHATTEYCATANNLSDVSNTATAISNLGAEAAAWTINAQTGTTYTLTAADFVNTLVTFNNASAITVTVPQTIVTTIAAGKKARCLNLGAGTVTFVAQGSDTLNGSKTLLTNAFSTITKVVAGSPNTYNVLAGTSTITTDYTLFIPTVANGTFYFNPKSSVAGTLTSIAGITSSGTCTVKVAINGVNVTGTSLSAGTSLTAQTITGANTFAVDSPIQAVISSNASALNLSLRVTYTTLQ